MDADGPIQRFLAAVFEQLRAYMHVHIPNIKHFIL